MCVCFSVYPLPKLAEVSAVSTTASTTSLFLRGFFAFNNVQFFSLATPQHLSTSGWGGGGGTRSLSSLIKRCIPNVMAFHNNEVTVLNPTFIPSTAKVIRIHENDGRQLCRNYLYGRDPLSGRTQLQELRERDFFALFPDFRVVFEDVLHNDGHLFRRCILQFIQLTENFTALV